MLWAKVKKKERNLQHLQTNKAVLQSDNIELLS